MRIIDIDWTGDIGEVVDDLKDYLKDEEHSDDSIETICQSLLDVHDSITSLYKYHLMKYIGGDIGYVEFKVRLNKELEQIKSRIETIEDRINKK